MKACSREVKHFVRPNGQDLGYSAGISWGICYSQATEFQRGGAEMDIYGFQFSEFSAKVAKGSHGTMGNSHCIYEPTIYNKTQRRVTSFKGMSDWLQRCTKLVDPSLCIAVQLSHSGFQLSDAVQTR